MLDIWVASVARAGGIEVPLTPTVAVPRAPGLVQRAGKAVAALVADYGRAMIRAWAHRPVGHRRPMKAA